MTLHQAGGHGIGQNENRSCCEVDASGDDDDGLSDREVNALADAISALKDVPPGKGF